MKRIFYNAKLKKICAIVLIVMMLFQWSAPVVLADSTVFNPKLFYPRSIKEDDQNNFDWDLNDWKLNPTIVTAYYEPIIQNGTMEAAALQEAIKAYNEKIEDAKTNNMSLKAAVDYAAGEASEKGNEIQVEIEQARDDQESANLGGILLSPVFYLINFIADAIISNLGNIMNGEGLSAISGTGVLIDTDKYDSSKYNTENMKEHNVNVSSFIPDVGSFVDGILGGNGDPYQYPNITYTPEEIFAGKVDLLSIDFISGKNYEGEQNSNEDWLNIRKVISQWYQVLRMIAIIGLLSVLIYTGIKILISANAKDKAKYKEWIMNWIMAAAILFFMHIIMAFIISTTGELSKLMSDTFQGIHVVLSDGNSFVTNLMGLVRFMIQSENFYIKVGYEVMYIALIWYTLKFTVTYLKRVLNMAFLTLIAPIVALTYPIDKINDGKAQGFDMWIKEYIFNALLQPMHLILYYVLVGSTVGVAASNPIYGIVVLAFMAEAEKLLKKIFGFDKAGGGTVGSMAGAFAAGAIASNIGKIAKMAGGNGGKGGSGNAEAENKLFDNPKPTEKPGMDVFDEDNGTAQQRMLDTYDEDRFGTDEYDSSEREAMARNAYSPEGQVLRTEEQRELLREQGWSEEEINDTLGAVTDNDESKEKSNRDRIIKGAKSVGKSVLKPAWDFDKSRAYNVRRLAKGAGRAALGAGLGIAAAAVQAGISITDGKYNPAEGLAAFGAGYAGAGQIGKGLGSLYNTYKEGTLPDDAKARKAEVMKRAKERFGDRDDVIAFNKQNYPGQEKAVMERQKNNYLTAGVTDLKEMKSGMKYADTLVKQGISQEKADRQAAATIDFKKTLESQGQSKAIYDQEKQQKYIQSMVDKASSEDKEKVRRQYQNAFKAAAAYDAANA